MLLQENTMFANRYQLERLLGRGGFSEVWLAKDSYTKLDIAIKVYAPGQGMDSDGLADFSQELAGVFNLNHTNLLKPTHVDAWEGMPYLIMSFCSRGSLTKQIGKLSEQELWHVLHDVAAGLAYLHKNDIVHQDIKPDNILLDDSGNYVITDFGISTKARSTLRKSVIGGAVSGGTMAYMGPERFSKQPAPTKASDIWSLGAMMFELVTGNVPFGDMGGGMQKSGAEIPEITENISSELKTIIEQMLSLNTWDRPTAEKIVPLALKQMDKPRKDLPIEDEEYPIGDDLVIDRQASNGRETERSHNSFRETQRETQNSLERPVNIEISETNIIAPADGTYSSPIEITCGQKWNITTSRAADWLHAREHVENKSILVYCDKNKTGKTRTAYVYIKSGEEQKSICVTQPSLPKSNSWVVWLILACTLIIGIPVGIGIYQQKVAEKAERERLEWEKKEKERKRQEDIQSTNLSVSNNSFIVGANGDVISLKVNSNRLWSIVEKPLWVLYKINDSSLELSVDYNPIKNTRQGYVYIKTTNDAKIVKILISQQAGEGRKKTPTAEIQKIWVDHNITRNNKLGMLIHVKFSVDYMFDKPLTVYAFFEYRDGESLKDFDNAYCADGKVYVDDEARGVYVCTQWNNYTLFMPYEQLDFTKGTLKNEPLKLNLGIWDNTMGKLLGQMKTFNFNVTY